MQEHWLADETVHESTTVFLSDVLSSALVPGTHEPVLVSAKFTTQQP